MKNLKYSVMAATATLMLASLSARAEIPNGTYTNEVSAEAPLWDLSGSYSGVLANGPTVSFTLTENSSGGLTGSGTFSVNDELFNVPNGNSSVVGKISGQSRSAKVSTDTMLTGNGSALGVPNASVAATVRITFGISAPGQQLVSGGGTVSVKVTNLDTGKKTSKTLKVSENNFPLPSNVTGGWGLSLTLTPNGTKLTGTGTITTSVGTIVPLTASGTYSSSSDTSKIKLTGSGVSVNLVISTSGTTMNIESLKAKAFGQTVSF
jgi:hypothetical protein